MNELDENVDALNGSNQDYEDRKEQFSYEEPLQWGINEEECINNHNSTSNERIVVQSPEAFEYLINQEDWNKMMPFEKRKSRYLLYR